jgi:CRP-like cAMP-binding protein
LHYFGGLSSLIDILRRVISAPAQNVFRKLYLYFFDILSAEPTLDALKLADVVSRPRNVCDRRRLSASDMTMSKTDTTGPILQTANRLLATLSKTNAATLAPYLETVHVPASTVLYEPEATLDWVYFPERGLISIITVMLSGATAESAVVGCEGAVGLIEAAGSAIFLSRALVQADLEARRVSARRYREALDGSATLRRAVADHAELNMAESRQSIACIAHHQADRRLARWLLECHDRANSGDQLPLTQEFLAAMLGLQRTTVTAIARQLRDEGLIAYRRGQVTILDRAGLERKCCECYATNQHFRSIIERPRSNGTPA